MLTLLWRRPLSYRNQSIDLLRKSIDWFLYDNGLRHKRVKFEMWPALCKLPALFPAANFTLGLLTFPNSSIDSKLRLLNFGLRLYFQVFPNLQRCWEFGIFEFWSSRTSQFFVIHGWDWKLGFCNICLDCTSNFFPVHWTVRKLGFLRFPCFHILSDWKDCLSSRVYVLVRGVNVHHVTILWQFNCRKHCFQA